MNEMINFVKVICLLLTFAVNDAADSRTFIDSKGTEHTTMKEKPTVVMFAHTAVSLKHFGLTEDQLVATYGEKYNSGSDVDVENPSAGSSLPADPEYEEIQFLEKVINLSPSCHIGYCTEFDLDTFLTLDVDEVIYHGYRGAWWGQNETYTKTLVDAITTKIGKPPIYIEASKEGSDICPIDARNSESICPGRSMIDIIEKNFEIAQYLNFDIPNSVNEDRQSLCMAAKEFQDNMQIAHDNGVRVMAAYLGTGTSYFADPTADSVLRMFEELGMPILHVGKCNNCSGNYFWEYIPLETYFQSCADGNVTATCNENPLYPVDFWLYDHRTTFLLNSPDFTLGFPDRALMEGQKGYWPIGGRLYTPQNAAEILSIVGPEVANANRIHPPTGCVPDVDVTGADHRTFGLVGGEYSCFNDRTFHNTKYYEVCKFFDPQPVSVAKPACYDMEGSIGGSPHTCICTAESCSESICNENGGIWADGCDMLCNCNDFETDEEEKVESADTSSSEEPVPESNMEESDTSSSPTMLRSLGVMIISIGGALKIFM